MHDVHGYCPLCISKCGTISSVDGGRLIRVRPDPSHPTGGSFCVKGKAAPELVHSDRRLRFPMMRTRPKGDPDPGWRRVSWDEALDFTASQLGAAAEQYGAESVVFGVTTPSGTAVADGFGWIHRLAHAFGSPNVQFATENCNWHKDFASALTFGSSIGVPDFEDTGCMLFWGFNPSVSWPAYAKAARRARRRGAKLIIVDPRCAGLAVSADQWLPVRPGTDGILAMAIAGCMIEHGWFDQDFIRHRTNGPMLVRENAGELVSVQRSTPTGKRRALMVWDAKRRRTVAYDPVAGDYLDEAPEQAALFADLTLQHQGQPVRCSPAFQQFARLCSQYSPERAAAICGVPADQILETARLLHQARPVSFFHWAGICQQAEATQTGRAISMLYLLTGCFGSVGGNRHFPSAPLNEIMGFDLLATDRLEKTLGRPGRPLGPPAKGWVNSNDFARAVLQEEPYAVKGLLSFGANPLLTKPNIPELVPALCALDVYVHCDLFMNPTAAYADLVLPVASPWEREGVSAGVQLGARGSAWLQLRQAVIPPQAESRSDTTIVFDLAKRLGLGDRFFDGDQRKALRHLIAPSGIALETLEAHPEGLRVECAPDQSSALKQPSDARHQRFDFYSESLLHAGEAPLPRFDDTELQLNGRYPLRLTTAKSAYFCHSQHHALAPLRAKSTEPVVELHPDLAKRRGIEDGDWVHIESAVGAMRARAALTSKIAADTVCAQYGWWESCTALDLPGYAIDQFNYNRLIAGTHTDRTSGSSAMRGYPCSIERESADSAPAACISGEKE